MCDEAVWINAAQVRVPCKALGPDHEVHLGLYQVPGELTRRSVRWSGPVGATLIDPPEIPTWPHPAEMAAKKAWEIKGSALP